MKLKINTEFLSEEYQNKVIPKYLTNGEYDIDENLVDDYLKSVSESSRYPIVIKKINNQYLVLPDGSNTSGMYFSKVKGMNTIEVEITKKEGNELSNIYVPEEFILKIKYSDTGRNYEFIDLDLDNLIFRKLLMNLYDNNITKFTSYVNMKVKLNNIEASLLRYNLGTLVNGHIAISGEDKTSLESFFGGKLDLSDALSRDELNKRYQLILKSIQDTKSLTEEDNKLMKFSYVLDDSYIICKEDEYNKDIVTISLVKRINNHSSSISEISLNLKDERDLILYKSICNKIDDKIKLIKPKSENDIFLDHFFELLSKGGNWLKIDKNSYSFIKNKTKYKLDVFNDDKRVKLSYIKVVSPFKDGDDSIEVRDTIFSQDQFDKVLSIIDRKLNNKTLSEIYADEDNREEEERDSLISIIEEDLKSSKDSIDTYKVDESVYEVSYENSEKVSKIITVYLLDRSIYYAANSSRSSEGCLISFSSYPDKFEKLKSILGIGEDNEDEDYSIVDNLRKKLHAPDYNIDCKVSSSSTTVFKVDVKDNRSYECLIDKKPVNTTLYFKRIDSTEPSIKLEYDDYKVALDIWCKIFKEFYNKKNN